MTQSSEAEKFNNAMDKLLKANPVVVKAAMKQEKQERQEERRSKRSSSSAPASSNRDA